MHSDCGDVARYRLRTRAHATAMGGNVFHAYAFAEIHLASFMSLKCLGHLAANESALIRLCGHAFHEVNNTHKINVLYLYPNITP